MALRVGEAGAGSLVWLVFAAIALPGAAAAAKKPPRTLTDLAIQAQKHGVDCPLPKNGACVVKKPVGTNYRVLTPGVNLEDTGAHWLADFTKIKDVKSTRLNLRVLGEAGDLHDIEVRFPPDPAAREKPPISEADKAKDAPKEAAGETK